MNPGENPVRASLIAALAAAEDAYDAICMDDPRRPELVRRIRAIEDALDRTMDQ